MFPMTAMAGFLPTHPWGSGDSLYMPNQPTASGQRRTAGGARNSIFIPSFLTESDLPFTNQSFSASISQESRTSLRGGSDASDITYATSEYEAHQIDGAPGLSSDISALIQMAPKRVSKSYGRSLPVSSGRMSTAPMHSHPEPNAGKYSKPVSSHINYTRTGRISRAKKGIQGAHPCSCGKTYSRAEHLRFVAHYCCLRVLISVRRHQQNHGPTKQCKHGCEKTFHRQDLLQRHEERW